LGIVRLDFMDQAQDWDNQFRELSLAQQVARARPARLPRSIFCKLCGEEIPKERRTAMPSAVHCVDCQTDIERVCR
jgi:phage/conjugal plasmid C-4 type zinc finger TraR family protein